MVNLINESNKIQRVFSSGNRRYHPISGLVVVIMKELLIERVKMLKLMLEYIDSDNPMYNNILVRIDEIIRILKEIKDNDESDKDIIKSSNGNVNRKINVENMLYFLNNRKGSLSKAISINKNNPEWVNEYQDYILGKINMCDAIICEIKRLTK